MKRYLGDYKLFVENKEEKLVYMINEYETYENCDYLQLHLELISGWDYVNVDESDVQGWCGVENFVEDIQDEYIYQYFLKESMEECLVENGYTVLKEINSSLQSIIDKHL